MPTDVIMPTLGLTMEQGTIAEWLKREGDPVVKGEPLFVVETDKSALEVPAETSGVLSRIIVSVGQTAPVRAPIAIITQPGDSAETASQPPADTSQHSALSPQPPIPNTQHPTPEPRLPTPRQKASPRARRVATELGVDLTALPGSGPDGRIVERDVRAAAPNLVPLPAADPEAPPERIVASPLARKLAAEHSLDLATLQGTGPGGRIVEKDIHAALATRSTSLPVGEGREESTPAPIPISQLPTPAATPLSRLRRITAERMAASSREVARVTLTMTVDMSEAVRFRTQLAPEFERRYSVRLGYDAMLAKAAALALRDHPELNAQWADGSVRSVEQVNIGTAVALDEGLLVVVVRDADREPLHQLQADLTALVERARAGRASPDDLSGSTFTITNLGAFGVETFTPIVNLPEAAILGVGRIAPLPAVVDNQLSIRDQMPISLAFDHRVTDGAPAARLLQRIKQILEAPYILLT